MDKSVSKKSGEELQEYIKFRKRGFIIHDKKTKYIRNEKYKNRVLTND